MPDAIPRSESGLRASDLADTVMAVHTGANLKTRLPTVIHWPVASFGSNVPTLLT